MWYTRKNVSCKSSNTKEEKILLISFDQVLISFDQIQEFVNCYTDLLMNISRFIMALQIFTQNEAF